MGGLCVCALGFGWLQAFCGLSLLSKWHLLEAPKNTKDFFCRGATAVKPGGAAVAEGKGWLSFP